MHCPCARSARTLLLVTGSQAVSGYLTLQCHCVVLLTLPTESRVETRHQALGVVSVCFESTSGFSWGVESVGLKVVFASDQAFLWILEDPWLNCDCRHGCLFFKATCRLVWQNLDFDLFFSCWKGKVLAAMDD